VRLSGRGLPAPDGGKSGRIVDDICLWSTCHGELQKIGLAATGTITSAGPLVIDAASLLEAGLIDPILRGCRRAYGYNQSWVMAPIWQFDGVSSRM